MIDNIFNLLSNPTYLKVFLDGAWGTLWISAVVVLFGTALGGIVALGKMSKIKVINMIASGYVEILRGTPILLQLYFFNYGGGQLIGHSVPEIYWIIIALVVNSSAYVAEVIRSGIQAVDRGQFEAAKSLGLSNKHMMTKVILPQAIKNILPALGNEFITMIKETSLASIFFITSLMTAESIVTAATTLKIESLIIVGVIYFVLTFSLSKAVQYFERRLDHNA
ncbi:amino acid ABC transporter permease [Erysipelothrix sp. HDW6C]|uniref:amino acid ABC transporter permease n=1 Tax=Erysipelothrix sp. HDW6C TaxID=2714930 RepID=UPI00140CC997|nr:amino acid ABC transporter permease [Erysipelothrix sp. HDW6C]QIK68849.1 amino acid ABC transporter permease [Erysipelothrix sp. HDW6C]